MAEKELEFLELNQENVLTIYKRCLIPKEDIGKESDNECRTKIFTVETSGKDSPEIVFNKKNIDSNSKTIRYLFGQLKVTHDALKRIYTCYGIYRLQKSTLD